MTRLEIVGLYVAIHCVMLIILAFRVGQVRMKERISLGDGNNFRLQQRIRTHGNYVEYTPMALIGLFALAQLSASPLMLHVFGLTFLIGRLLHIVGMDGKHAIGKGRPAGMVLTILTFIGLAGSILFLIFT